MVHSLADIAGNSANQRLSATSVPCNWWQVQASGTQTSDIRVGDSLISSTRGAIIFAGSNGAQFAPPAGNTNCYNLNDVFVLVQTGDKVAVVYSTV